MRTSAEEATVYTSTFIFEAKPHDEEFHRFNDEIPARARAVRVVLGEVLSTYGQPGLGLAHIPEKA